jgi:hypothetical protein
MPAMKNICVGRLGCSRDRNAETPPNGDWPDNCAQAKWARALFGNV